MGACLAAEQRRAGVGKRRTIRKYALGRFTAIDESAMEALESYGWPGNVRELQNIIERACALSEGQVLSRRDLPEHVLTDAAPGLGTSTAAAQPMSGDALTSSAELPLKDAKERWLQVLEASYLRDILDRHGGNVSAAAQAAGIDRKTFHRLLNKYKLR